MSSLVARTMRAKSGMEAFGPSPACCPGKGAPLRCSPADKAMLLTAEGNATFLPLALAIFPL